jgi:alpha-L-fucosidase 2
MKPMLKKILLLAIASAAAFLSTPARGAESPGEPLSLWYSAPAHLTNWTSALPIGNGRLGAMIFGGVERERLQLNEDTLWAGGPYDPSQTNALIALPQVRRLIFEGNYSEAHRLVGTNMLSRPVRQMQYQTVGDLFLTFAKTGPVEHYYRDLNLDTAVASVSYEAGGTKFTRELFSSPVDQVIVVRLTADKPGQISFTANFSTPQKSFSKASMATRKGLKAR